MYKNIDTKRDRISKSQSAKRRVINVVVKVGIKGKVITTVLRRLSIVSAVIWRQRKEPDKSLNVELLAQFKQQKGGPVTFMEYMRGKHELLGIVGERDRSCRML